MVVEDMTKMSLANGSASPSKSAKRTDYINWDDYFMGVALLTAQRSKDPSTQVGCVIVNKEQVIVGTGYNGMPRGLDDNVAMWGKGDPDPLKNKTMYVCHAELNAILNKNCQDIRGCTVYTTLFPCCECAKAIIQCGVKHVVYLTDRKEAAFQASRNMFEQCGVSYELFKTTRQNISLNFGAK